MEIVFADEPQEVLLLSKKDLERILSKMKQEEKKAKKPKKALIKLHKRIKNNAKGHQELVNIEKVKRQINFRNYAVY